ncbi:putative ribonuclease H-like domain-containing protein [Tanacetum coccineum]|uniref:Ribonuclease H-like domain-containing protein n=1 Tax=Tanacetum coccineum TaxID=301880 RepID=A0ABQ5DVT0_9ASTR
MKGFTIKARFGGNEASKKGSTLKQSTAEPAHIPKEYTQAISSKVPTAPNCASYSMKSMFPSCSQASMPTTHENEEPCCKLMKMLWKEMNIRCKFITQKPWWRTDNNEDIDLDQEFDAEHNKADDAPVSLALMATNSEVPYCSKCSKSYKKLLESYQQKEIYCQRARTEILGYQMSLESLEVMLKTHEKNEYAWGDKAKSYKAVPPPTGTIIPPRAIVSFTGIDELAIRNKVVDQEKTKSSQSAIDRNKVIIEDWVDSDDEETDVSESQKETAFNSENSETSFENSQNSVGQESRTKGLGNKGGKLCFGNPEEDLKDYAIIDSGCSGSGRISGKGTIKTSCLDFEKVSYVEELKFNLLSVSQICDKKHNVLFTDKECLILSPKFKLLMRFGNSQSTLLYPRKNDVYSLDLKNIIPSGGITCLVAKATEDEAVLWHRRLGHVNFKNINKLVKGNLVRGLPSKTFKLDHSCLACRKVESINKKKYCLVVTDDCSKFSWVFFLTYKDETYDMLHDLIVGLENRLRHKSQKKEILLGYSTTSKGLESITGQQRKERKLSDSNEQGISVIEDEDLDDNQFIVHTASAYASGRERTAAKEVSLSTEEQALHDELVSLMHQGSLAKAHNDDQRSAFEEEKRRISIAKGKEHVDSTFTLSTANTPPQSTGNTPTDSDDDTPKDAMQEELLQFKLQDARLLCDLPEGTRLPNWKQEIRLFWHLHFPWLTVYQMDVKSAFLYGNITEEVYVKQPPGFEDPAHHQTKVYRLSKSLMCLGNQAQRAWKDEEGVKMLMYDLTSMIGCLMYLTASRPDIMLCVLSVCKVSSHSKGFSFNVQSFLDSDYAGDNHDRRSTSGGLSNNYVKKTGLLAMQETNNCGYLLYRSRICSSCKLLCSGSLDAKSTT